ncbi:MAG TPA: hypothetical protein VF365_12710 [Candidatus Limnocylindria bacterium]
MTRHPADFVSLAFGLLFGVIGLVMLSGDQLAISWAWLGPATVIGLGAILIAAGWSRRTTPDGP